MPHGQWRHESGGEHVVSRRVLQQGVEQRDELGMPGLGINGWIGKQNLYKALKAARDARAAVEAEPPAATAQLTPSREIRS